MKTIEIENKKGISLIEQLNKHLNGSITTNYGEEILEFNNEYGRGNIRNISFDWGISLLDYHVTFSEDIKIIYHIKETTPIEFLYVSSGNLKYTFNDDTSYMDLERFQNVIISNKANSKNTYWFPKETGIHLNTIQVLSEAYKKKMHNNIDSLQENLLSVFNNKTADRPYKHFGNYNLKIAKEINDLNKASDSGIVRSLSVEGQLNLILALQILEHKNFMDNVSLPESLSQKDIKKIHDVANYVIDHISNYISIKTLSKEFGITPKKLQSGFQLLYSKSVNEYVRQIKLEIARDLIKNSEQSISEIVYNIGYKSRSYFSKIFFDKYNILPTDYREMLKKAEQSKNV